MYSLSMLCQCSSHVHKAVGASWPLHTSAANDNEWPVAFDGDRGNRAGFAPYSGGVGVSWVRYIAWTSSSSWIVGPTTAMPRASMERQFRV